MEKIRNALSSFVEGVGLFLVVLFTMSAPNTLVAVAFESVGIILKAVVIIFKVIVWIGSVVM